MRYPGDDNQTEAGFTLLEVLVAVSIMASLTAIMWISISSMFNTRDVVTDRFERYQIMRIAMQRMTREVSSAYLAGPEHNGEELPAEREEEEQGSGSQSEDGSGGQSGSSGSLSQQLEEPIQYGMIGRDDELHFTSFAHRRAVEDELAGHHAEISYYTERQRNDDGDLVTALMRREDVTPDDDLEQGGEVYTMIPNIEEIEFEYWDPGPVELGTMEEVAEQGRWKDRWDTTKTEFSGRLPTRIRITIVLPPENERSSEKTFQTQVQIGATEVLEF